MADSAGSLRLEVSGAIAIWTIDRPQAKNALDFASLDAIAEACVRLGPEIRAVVLTGEGDAFAAGGDLRELKGVVTAEDAAAFAERGARTCRAIAELRVPVLAAVHGAAYGGGAELAIACDLRAVDATSRIGFRQARMGVTTAWGTLDRLVALVGAGVAARLLFTTDDVADEEALAIGLAEASGKSAFQVAMGLANQIALVSPAAVSAQKALLRRPPPTVGTNASERSAFVETWLGPDHTEAMDAFFARRAPSFRSS